MRNLLAVILCILFVSTVQSQIEISPEQFILQTNGDDIQKFPTVTNNSSETVDLFWTYQLGEDYPAEWSHLICDDTLCYAPNAVMSSPFLPNTLEAGESFNFDIKIFTSGVAGSTYGILCLYDDQGFNNEVACTKMPTSVSEAELANIRVWPNPAIDLFSITGDSEIKRVVARDLSGKAYIDMEHTEGQVHHISEFNEQILLVSMLDASGDVIKTEKLFVH